MNRPPSPSHVLVAASLVTMLCAPCLTSPLRAQQGGDRTPRGDSLRQAQQFDIAGNYAAARAIFRKLIDNAPDPASKAAAQRRMAMSHGFEGHCSEAVRYEEMVIDYWKTREKDEPQNAFYQEGEMANEAARLCIDAGDLATAERMYKRGSELGLKEPEPRTHPKALWDYRLAHAMARIAARKGDKAEAQRQVAIARKMLDADPTMAANQERFFPYLTGYVALYTNDLKTAEADLTRAIAMQGNSTDPFMHALLGMTHEKMGHAAVAKEWYQKAYDLSTQHTPPSAFTRAFARKKIGAAG
jgi:tetratricopeptide (TPR) repeat protein